MAPKFVVLESSSFQHKQYLMDILTYFNKQPLAVVPSLDFFCACPKPPLPAPVATYGYAYENSLFAPLEACRPMENNQTTRNHHHEQSVSNEVYNPVFEDLKKCSPPFSMDSTPSSVDDGYSSSFCTTVSSPYSLASSSFSNAVVTPSGDTSVVQTDSEAVKPKKRKRAASPRRDCEAKKPKGPIHQKIVMWAVLVEALFDDNHSHKIEFRGTPEKLCFAVKEHSQLALLLARYSSTPIHRLSNRLYTYFWYCRQSGFLEVVDTDEPGVKVYEFTPAGFDCLVPFLQDKGLTMQDFMERAVHCLTNQPQKVGTSSQDPLQKSNKRRVFCGKRGHFWPKLVTCLKENQDYETVKPSGNYSVGFTVVDMQKMADRLFSEDIENDRMRKLKVTLANAVSTQHYLTRNKDTYIFTQRGEDFLVKRVLNEVGISLDYLRSLN